MQFNQNNTPLVANQYTYDSMSRLATVSDGTNTAAYSRISGSNLLNTTTITAGGVTKMTATRNYDAQNRLTSISSVSSVPSVVKTYSYTYDDKDRRSRLDMADGSYWLYTYDAKGQIASGTKYDSTGKAIPGQAFSYAYDDIGNLTTEQRGMPEMQYSYNSNPVNQYTQRLVPGIIPVTGQASVTSTVSVWLKNHGANAAAVTRPTRDGEYFKAAIPVNNTAANVTEALEITAVKFNTTLDKDVVKTINGTYTVPKTPQLFTNDDDGDMTGDGVWNYIWNGENRLISSTNSTNSAKLEYVYDYMGRRVSKKTYSWVGGAWQLDKHLKFVYDGYKQIAEYDGTAGTMQKNYTWQPGSVGQDVPLWLNTSGSAYYYVVDGNKNVTALVDSSGALAAEYEYGQFGEILSRNGAMADINPFRFSSEFFDIETGLIYYNYRYYSPELRRWLSRDPSEEKGGYNLYVIAGNDLVNKWDCLGKFMSGDLNDPMNPDNPNSIFNPNNFPQPTMEKPDTSDGLSYIEGAMWYFYGNGDPLDVPFSVIDQGFGVKDFINPCSYKNGSSPIAATKGHDLFTMSTVFTIAGPGRIDFNLEGTLTKSGYCWSFSGIIKAPPNEFNFDPNETTDARGFLKEWMTRIIHNFGKGKSFWVNFPGERNIKETGRCP